MSRKRHMAAQVIHKLRGTEVTLSQGQSVDAVCKGMAARIKVRCRTRVPARRA